MYDQASKIAKTWEEWGQNDLGLNLDTEEDQVDKTVAPSSSSSSLSGGVGGGGRDIMTFSNSTTSVSNLNSSSSEHPPPSDSVYTSRDPNLPQDTSGSSSSIPPSISSNFSLSNIFTHLFPDRHKDEKNHSLVANQIINSENISNESGMDINGGNNSSSRTSIRSLSSLEKNSNNNFNDHSYVLQSSSVNTKILSSSPVPFSPSAPSASLSRPVLIRGSSLHGNNETKRQTLMNMVSQIRQYDPYPCVLGIPMMPALYSTCKFYLFFFFTLIGLQVMVAAFRRM